MPDELPVGWDVASMSDLGMVRPEPIDPSSTPDVKYQLWSVPSFSNGEPEYKLGKEIESGKQIVQENDVLLCKINPRLNRVWLVGRKTPGIPQIASTEWIVLRNNKLCPAFFQHRFRDQAFRTRLMETVSGVGGSLMRARPDLVKEIECAVPPLPEQRRIVARIEALQARSQKAREALEEVGPLLEQFRQSVLAAAFRGDLTADWRAKHPNIEPASILLERIRQERRQKWEAANPKKKYVEPEPVDESDLPELPEGWQHVSLGDISSVERGRFLVRPRNDPSYFGGSFPFVQIGDLPPNGGNIDKYKQTLNSKGLSVSRMFPTGTMLIAIVGATIGNTGLLTIDCWCTDSLVGIQALTSNQTRYLEFYFRLMKQAIRKVSYASGGQPNINLQTLLPYPVPLPPEREIDEIVRVLGKALAFIDHISNTAIEMRMGLDKVNQSILAKAFRGELVPQDPNDEPASVLLERIRAEREKQSPKEKKTRGRNGN